MTRALTKADFERALSELAEADPALARIGAEFGPPPRRRRDQGFATVVLLILEQQVSLASADATFARLSAAAGVVEPDRILALGEEKLRQAGLSRQKARYVEGLAHAVAAGTIDFRRIARSDDQTARDALVALKGIGTWTADIYLLSALQRPDIWPARDLALQVAAHEIKALDARPDEATLVEIGEAWRPWRSVAARLLWHYYLNTVRNKRAKPAKPTARPAAKLTAKPKEA